MSCLWCQIHLETAVKCAYRYWYFQWALVELTHFLNSLTTNVAIVSWFLMLSSGVVSTNHIFFKCNCINIVLGILLLHMLVSVICLSVFCLTIFYQVILSMIGRQKHLTQGVIAILAPHNYMVMWMLFAFSFVFSCFSWAFPIAFSSSVFFTHIIKCFLIRLMSISKCVSSSLFCCTDDIS